MGTYTGVSASMTSSFGHKATEMIPRPEPRVASLRELGGGRNGEKQVSSSAMADSTGRGRQK